MKRLKKIAVDEGRLFRFCIKHYFTATQILGLWKILGLGEVWPSKRVERAKNRKAVA